MARRSSFSRILTQMAREQAKGQRQREVEAKRKVRESERAIKDMARQKNLADKESKLCYQEARVEETEQKNIDLLEYIHDIQRILEHTFDVDDTISFDSLRIKDEFPEFQIPDPLVSPTLAPKKESYFCNIQSPNKFQKLIPGVETKYQKLLVEAEANFMTAWSHYEKEEAERQEKINALREDYQKEKAEFSQKMEQRNQEVIELETAYRNGDPQAIIAYNTMVLERSVYPDGFPQEFRVAYVPEPKELVIEYELPNVYIIPPVAEYKYIKAKDAIEEKERKATEIRELYQDLVASICLRTIHEVFEADQCGHLLVVAFNGFVQTVDPSTGKDTRPCLISIRTTRNVFMDLDLRRIDKKACLRNLGAQVSPKPVEMQPVKPIIEFEMVDKRFVEQSDVLGDLDSRPNLMELDPFEFENLVSNLFNRMGLETKQTRSSKDGGVDAIAFDIRPVLGGKVVIQAKRYKNTVGVSAVRDLYGTMINEGANKGILVATSSYGPDAYEFSKDKPIELIDGGGLLYLLDQVGVKAKIIFLDE